MLLSYVASLTDRDEPTLKIAVVVPTYNGGTDLTACLQALASSTLTPHCVVVVDDGSTDGVAKLEASRHDFNYVRVEDGPTGPARARNIGVASCDSDVVLFVDSDVVVTADSIQQIHDHFTNHPEVDALFGSYDSKPAVETMVSRYKNLLHHFVHQNSNRDASTFWAGFGAVRRNAFISVNGFDEAFNKPCIEDIDLGLRLSQAKFKIELCPEIQVKHLKHWTLPGLIRTDIFSRAVPWTKLMIAGDTGLKNDLNVRNEHRLSALVCILLSISVFAMLLGYNTTTVSIILSLLYLFLDRNLFRFFFRTGGVKLTLGASILHYLYYLYASTTFVLVHLVSYFQKKQAPLAVQATKKVQRT